MENLKTQVNAIEFDIDPYFLDGIKSLSFYIKERKTLQKFDIPFSIVNNHVTLNFLEILICLNVVPSRFDLWFIGYKNEILLNGRIGNYFEKKELKYFRYKSQINEIAFEKNFIFVPYLTENNEIALVWNSKDKVHRERKKYNFELIQIKKKNKYYSVKIKQKKGINVISLCLVSRNENRNELEVLPYKETASFVLFRVSFKNINALSLYYDFFVKFINDFGDIQNARVKAKSRFQVQTRNLLLNRGTVYDYFNLKYIFTPYFTDNGYLSLQVRENDEYDSIIYFLKELFSILLVPILYKKYKDSNLIYEKFSTYARDNSFYYFKYVQENFPDNKLFFVIKKNSSDLLFLSKYKNRVVYFMSIKHIVLCIVSKYLIASEAKGHAYAWRHNTGFARFCINKKPFVFLQHGVLGLKQVDNTFFSSNKINHANLFVTSSKIEKKIVMDYLGYNADDIVITGLSRWDDKVEMKKENIIFIMPTWRTHLEFLSSEEFLSSDFYIEYSSILYSEKMNLILKKYSYSIHFMLHPKLEKFESFFRSPLDNVKILYQSEMPLDKEIKKSKIVITDYSSIIWDSLYYDIPIILFQFDQKHYLGTQGSYLNFNKDFEGFVVFDSMSLVKKIEEYILFENKVNLIEFQRKFFKYIDKKNSYRIHSAVKKWETSFEFNSIFHNYKKLMIKKYFNK